MWSFGTEQKVADIGTVKVGGLPGQQPTVLVGSIFYAKHSVVIDESKGEFDRERAEELLKYLSYKDASGKYQLLTDWGVVGLLEPYADWFNDPAVEEGV
jgi:tetrahydromethanopterin S-methyltransferase subunit H